MTLSLPPPADGACPQVRPLPLPAEQAQELHRLRTGRTEPMGGTGVELGRFPRDKHQIVLPQHDPELPVEDVQPLVPLMDL